MNSIAISDNKKPNSKQEVIAANVQILIEQLEAGHSEYLTAYLIAMSRFHRYSFGNVLEIARQMPTATRVAGFWTWKNLGRSVKAGQKGIRILGLSSAFAARKSPQPIRTSRNRTSVSCWAFVMPTSSTSLRPKVRHFQR